jgi:hypothetical protein
MRLSQLEPRFYKIVRPNDLRQEVDTLAEAQGLIFLCPKCFAENGGAVGTHSVLCWFLGRGVPDSEEPGPGRWEALGTGVDDLTFRAGSSSILLTSGCRAHFFIRDGEVISC